jgi:alpha-amylase
MKIARGSVRLLWVAAVLLAGCGGPAATHNLPGPSPLPPTATTAPSPTVATAPSAASPLVSPAAATAAPLPSATPAPPTAAPAQNIPVTRVAPVTGLPAGTGGQPWWNDAVFYEVFVRSFFDSNGDGIGDLNGLIARLDVLNDGNPASTADLGVNALWLLPVHPSPSYHGYDVTDFYGINPQYGTLSDFRRLLTEAHKRGIRVIIDLVLNHTSSQNPWFVSAQDPQSPFRNWYVWSKTDPGWLGPWGEVVWHPGDGGYYYGVYNSGMPDLNYRNPAVTAKMDDVVRFWLQQGVDGFRLDSAKHLIEEGSAQTDTPSTHAWYKSFRPFYKALNPQAVTVGEVQDITPLVADYVQGDQLDLAFDFNLAGAFITSARTGRADAAEQALSVDAPQFKPGQFATFLSNHDQNRILSQLAGKPDKGKVAATMLLTAPGVPFIYYGEEIGMLGLDTDEQRRAPMQWSSGPNAGFTSGTPWEPVQPDFAQGKNVADEAADPNSLFSHYRALIHLRNQHSALRVGDWKLVEATSPAVYALLRFNAGETLLTVVNLSGDAVTGCALKLAAGPLRAGASYGAASLLGGGAYAGLTAGAQGGFDGYQPAPLLPPYSSMILQLQPLP